jgi:hypothetical protein
VGLAMNEPTQVCIKSNYIEYTEVVNHFSEEKITQRYLRLLDSAKTFIENMGYNDYVVCNETLLMLAVLGYFSDIIRLKNFHKIGKANEIKICAYETAWLLKRKPLQIKDSNEQKYAFCNEQFAYSQIVFLLENGCNEGTKVFTHKELRYFSDSLFYHLKYRGHEPQTLELMLISFIAGRKYQQLLSEV